MKTLTDSNKSKRNTCINGVRSVRDLANDYERQLRRVNTINEFDFNSKKHPRTKFLSDKTKK